MSSKNTRVVPPAPLARWDAEMEKRDQAIRGGGEFDEDVCFLGGNESEVALHNEDWQVSRILQIGATN